MASDEARFLKRRSRSHGTSTAHPRVAKSCNSLSFVVATWQSTVDAADSNHFRLTAQTGNLLEVVV